MIDCCKRWVWQPAWCHQYRSCTYKQLQEDEEVPKQKAMFKSMLTHWLKETLDFAHLMAQHAQIQHFVLTSWKKRSFSICLLLLRKSNTVGVLVLKDRTDKLFQSWAEQLQSTSVRKRCCSTWMMGMSRHRCGEYRAWTSKVLLLTLFAKQIFDHTLGFFLQPCQITPSFFTLFLAQNGFAQAGPVLLVWWLLLTHPVDLALWQVPVTP